MRVTEIKDGIKKFIDYVVCKEIDAFFENIDGNSEISESKAYRAISIRICKRLLHVGSVIDGYNRSSQ